MGVVYKAEDANLDRLVALKFLPPELTRDPEAKERFIHEAKAASALNHTNICSIHTIEEFEKQQFIDMEFVEGKTLALSMKGKELPLKQIIDIVIQIAKGLNAAHRRGIVHRDIKPDNIMITDESLVKIMDFGLAKLKGSSKVTKTHSTLGTLSYMSPEQARGEEVDQRTDIFSLGAVLYEMITSRRPFKGEHEAAVIYSLTNETPEPLARYRANVSDDLQRVVEKALAKNKGDRYQHVDELLVDLRSVQRDVDNGSENKIFNITRSLQKKLWYIVATILFLVVLFILFKSNLFTPAEQPTENIPISSQKPSESGWTNSIAVLPFRDFSAKKDQEYFCNGMTDAIIGRLAKIPELKVLATTSVMRYKNTDKDIKEIGRELNVANVLEGTLQKEKNKIRLSAQLINTESGFHLWADTYDRELTKVFEIQDEISIAISEALKVTLTARARETSKSGLPQNLETYEYQLRGMNLINNYIIHRREEDFTLALAMFQKAIELEPMYAASYSGLAWAYKHHIEVTGNQSEALYVLKNSETAYEKNPNSPEANAAMGWVYHERGNQDKAFEYFRKALELNPNSMAINHVAALFLTDIGLYHQAIKYFHKANDLDPYYLYALSSLAGRYRDIGEYKIAEALYEKVSELAPNDAIYERAYAYLLILKKEYDRADALLNRAEKIKPEDSTLMPYRALYWAVRGEKSKAIMFMHSPNDLVFAPLGMNNEAIACLKQGIKEEKSRSYLYLLHNPLYDNLRSDPHFQDIIAKQKIIYEERLKKYGIL